MACNSFISRRSSRILFVLILLFLAKVVYSTNKTTEVLKTRSKVELYDCRHPIENDGTSFVDITPTQPVVEGNVINFTCKVNTRSTPVSFWCINGESIVLTNNYVYLEPDGRYTNTLQLPVTRNMSGHEIRCRFESKEMDGVILERNHAIEVYYKPDVELTILAFSKNVSVIRCSHNQYPTPYHIEMLRNRNVLSSFSPGLYKPYEDYRITNLKYQENFTCSVRNEAGETNVGIIYKCLYIPKCIENTRIGSNYTDEMLRKCNNDSKMRVYSIICPYDRTRVYALKSPLLKCKRIIVRTCHFIRMTKDRDPFEQNPTCYLFTFNNATAICVTPTTVLRRRTTTTTTGKPPVTKEGDSSWFSGGFAKLYKTVAFTFFFLLFLIYFWTKCSKKIIDTFRPQVPPQGRHIHEMHELGPIPAEV